MYTLSTTWMFIVTLISSLLICCLIWHSKIYLLFSIILTLSTHSIFSRRRFAWHVDSYSFSRSIRTHLECLLDTLERSTFSDSNCRVGWDDFNDSEIMKKDADLTLQTSERILTALTARSLSNHHLPSLGLISTRWLSHILWKA